MGKIVISTTPSFTDTVDAHAHLASLLARHTFSYILQEDLRGKTSFDKKDVVAIVAGAKKIGKEEMQEFPRLRIIVRFGKGIDNIDCAEAKSRGILVKNIPAANSDAVAEMTVAFIFALARDILRFDKAMKEEKWERWQATGVQGKQIGIIGCGDIGKNVADRAYLLGMNVCVHDIHYDEAFFASRPFIARSDITPLLQSSDFVSLHVPLTDSTHHLIHTDMLSYMKSSSYVINTSRGAVVDEKALLDALEKNRIRGAALDVYSKENPFTDAVLQKLISHPHVIATPQIATFTPETQYAVAAAVIQEILASHALEK